MKIEELFDMPINKMRDWMRDNFKKIEPKVKYENAYFDFFESFGLEESKNWRNMPIVSYDWCRGNYGSILNRMIDNWESVYFAVAKISKYGECLVYVFVGNWYYDDEDHAHYHDPKHLEIDKIYCNDTNGNEKCHCFAEGPDIVNNSRLCVYEDEGNTSTSYDHNHTWFKAFPWLDIHPSVYFKTMPTIGGIKKNKHTINEYNEKIEKFAKRVMESSPKFNELYKASLDDLKEKSKSIKIDSKYVSEIWRALFVENEETTLDDVIGIIRLLQSEEQLVIDYVDSCKGESIEYDKWDKKWEICESFYGPHPYRFCKLYDTKAYVDTTKYIGFVKDLEATRKMYSSIDNYKNTIDSAKKEYKEEFKKLASEFETNIMEAYMLAVDKLRFSKDNYLKKTKELYDSIHNKYAGVNDLDVGIFDDQPNIIEDVKNEFFKTSIKLMRLLQPSYKNKKNEKKENDKSSFSNEFISQAKILFDACPDVDKIPFFAEGKAYDAPYEQYERDVDIVEHIGDEAVYEYEEKHGQGSYVEWEEKFLELAPHYKVDCDDCYPGWTRFYCITRNFDEVCDEED